MKIYWTMYLSLAYLRVTMAKLRLSAIKSIQILIPFTLPMIDPLGCNTHILDPTDTFIIMKNF